VRTPTVCTTPTCQNRTQHGRCAQCRAARDKRPSAAARGYDAKWRRTRGRYLQLHPTCEEPGCTEPAIDVHHLDGLGPLGPRGHQHHNLLALCKTHHSQRTAREQPGGWNQ
jgi:5-methylcytosine-specific restriction protein A